MRWLCIAAILLASCSPKAVETPLFEVDPATAASISGQVRFAGKPGNPIVVNMDQDPECSKLYKDGRRPDEVIAVSGEGSLANAFVYVKSGLEDKRFATPASTAAIDQKGCWFQPRVIGMQAGQQLEVTNSDPVTHNIHPLPQNNREWNHSQAPQEAPLKHRFTQPEVMIRVKCNVHKWMRAWIGVLPHPYFAVTGKDGAFQLQGLPPGKYTIAVWHEKLGTLEQSVSVAPAASQQLAFQFSGQ